jgi:ribonuclease E
VGSEVPEADEGREPDAAIAAEAEREAQIRGTIVEGDGSGDSPGERKRRRRGRRGGRRRRREHEGGAPEHAGEFGADENGAGESNEHHDEPLAVALVPVMEATDSESTESTESTESFVNDRDTEDGADIPASEAPPEPVEANHPQPAAEHAPRAPEPPPEAEAEPDAPPDSDPAAASAPLPADEPETAPAGQARRGWWRRR